MRDNFFGLTDRALIAILYAARFCLYGLLGAYVTCLAIIIFIPLLSYCALLGINNLSSWAVDLCRRLTNRSCDALDWFDIKRRPVKKFNRRLILRCEIACAALQRKQAAAQSRLASRWRQL